MLRPPRKGSDSRESSSAGGKVGHAPLPADGPAGQGFWAEGTRAAAAFWNTLATHVDVALSHSLTSDFCTTLRQCLLPLAG